MEKRTEFEKALRRIPHPSLAREYRMLYVRDIMGILGVSESLAYKLIKQLNSELDAAGFITIHGRVPERKFRERFYMAAEILGETLGQ